MNIVDHICDVARINVERIPIGYCPPYDLNDIQLYYELRDFDVKYKNHDAIVKIQERMFEDIKRCIYNDVFYYSSYDEYFDNMNRYWIMSMNAFTGDTVHKLWKN